MRAVIYVISSILKHDRVAVNKEAVSFIFCFFYRLLFVFAFKRV